MGGGGGRSATSRTKIEAAQRRAKALELRKAGATFEQIAQQLHYTDRSQAYRSTMQALREVTYDKAEDVLNLELSRLDAMMVGAWGAARRGEPQAIHAILRIMERRAKYLGLDDFESRMAAVAEQQVQITEQQAETVVSLLQGVLSDLGLTDAQQARAPEVIVSQMRRLALVAAPEEASDGS